MIDVDALFDKYLDDFIDKNIDKYSPHQIEKMIVQIYEEFSNTPNLVLCGLSPVQYFANMKTDELLEGLKTFVESGLSVCELLSSLPKPFSVTYKFSKGKTVSSISFISSASCSHTGALSIDTTLNIKCPEKQVTENDFESSTDYDTSNLDSVFQSEE